MDSHLPTDPPAPEKPVVDPPSLPPIRACLFDMDGLLIDSEDIYTLCINEILHRYGKPSLPWNIKAQLQGRPAAQSSEIFQAWAQLPISHSEYLAQLTALQRIHFPTSKPLPGISSLLAQLSSQKIHLALATSSHSANYHLKTSHLAPLFAYFPLPNRVLGDDPRIPPGRGKPHPDIYLVALETINAQIRADGAEPEIKPEECLVFEDSVPGVESGRRAGMRVIWCPHPELLKEYRGRESQVLAGLTRTLGLDETEIGGVVAASGRGWPGRVDDGWADLVVSLERWNGRRYGIPG